jgi:hypothetical protein
MRNGLVPLMLIFALVLGVNASAEPSEKPRQRGDLPDIANFGGISVSAVAVRKMVNADGTTTVVNEDGREITIVENDDGITVRVDENGQTRETTSADAGALEAEHPEAFDLYNRFCRGVEHGGGMHLVGPGGQAVAGPLNARINTLGVRVMAVHDPFVLAQLGEGVSIVQVYDDTRASRIGLRQFDYLRSINGTQVASTQQVIEALQAVGDEKLTLEITRAGEKLTLNE